jgi:hypothetical protein
MNYLVTWEGYTSGSPGGRDDGYPETQMEIVSTQNLDERLRAHKLNRRSGVRVFEIGREFSETEKDNLIDYADKQHEKRERAKKEQALQQLANELGKTVR